LSSKLIHRVRLVANAANQETVVVHLCVVDHDLRFDDPFDGDAIDQSSFLTFILLWTPLTPSVSRAMAAALSAAS
jgi:hypothetical protein